MSEGQLKINEFKKKMSARRAAGLCCCWDHLRADGITPPLPLRSNHARRYPHTIFAEDPGGEPCKALPKKDDEDAKPSDKRSPEVRAAERSHLREAVANRSVM